MDQLIHLILIEASGLLAYASLVYILALALKRNDIADVAWGLGYCFIALWLLLGEDLSGVAIIQYILVILWGLRLSIHIFLRNRGKQEDFRYKQWREEWGRSFYWRSYVQVFVLQASFILVISLPLLWASIWKAEVSSITVAGITLWIAGFAIQVIGDFQLEQFKKFRKPGEIMQSGLWKYSRHPNYLGEILMWWGVAIMVLPLPYGFVALVSPATITWLLAFVSGVPMLEAKYKGNEAYEEYKRRTPALFPRLF